ncbi:MAG: TraB/GumN family protein, partial [Desulfobacteraceae bacterium]
FLLQSLQEMEVLAERADDMIRAWEKGDASALEETNKRGYEGFPDLYQRFIVERNNRWIPDIQSLFDRHGNTLVIVGAGHLVGDQGMIRLLEKKGYQLDQH